MAGKPWTRGVMLPAYAKINLTLEVLGRRTDGYHDLVSVMQTIALHDTIALLPAPAGTYTLACDDLTLAGDDNLVLRAARLLEENLAPPPMYGVAIELRKAIPAQAGLGGGSSDAATALVMLHHVWDGQLSDERLNELAAQLGSDVPFFLTPGTSLVRGRGERVQGLPPSDPLWLVLLKPPVAVSTAAAFKALTPTDFGDGSASEAVSAALKARRPLPVDRLANSFERSVLGTYPEVTRAWDAFHEAGAPVVRLSGSGPTLFAPFRELLPASAVYQRLCAGGHQVWLTHTVSRMSVESAYRASNGD